MMLAAGARMTLFYPASGEAVELRGPGSFQLATDAVQPVSSAAAPARLQLNAAFRDIKLDRTRLAPAGVRMRDPRLVNNIVLLEPSGIVLAEDALRFRWEPVRGVADDSESRTRRREVLHQIVMRPVSRFSAAGPAHRGERLSASGRVSPPGGATRQGRIATPAAVRFPPDDPLPARGRAHSGGCCCSRW
jgi:hypothetical protein